MSTGEILGCFDTICANHSVRNLVNLIPRSLVEKSPRRDWSSIKIQFSFLARMRRSNVSADKWSGYEIKILNCFSWNESPCFLELFKWNGISHVVGLAAKTVPLISRSGLNSAWSKFVTFISPLKRTYVTTSAAYVAARLVTWDLNENFISIPRI